MKLYHGSDIAVTNPRIIQSTRLLDFGSGFYTTTNYEQAVKWAERVAIRRDNKICYVSSFTIDIEQAIGELDTIIFNEPDKEWLEFITKCRRGINTNVNYDIAIGPVANDNVYTVVKLYETGVLDTEETIKRLKVVELFDQTLFHTEESLKWIKFNNTEQKAVK